MRAPIAAGHVCAVVPFASVKVWLALSDGVSQYRKLENTHEHIEIHMHTSDSTGNTRKRLSKNRLCSVDLDLGDHLVGMEAERIEGEPGATTMAVRRGAAACGGVRLTGQAIVWLAGGFTKGAEAQGRLA